MRNILYSAAAIAALISAPALAQDVDQEIDTNAGAEVELQSEVPSIDGDVVNDETDIDAQADLEADVDADAQADAMADAPDYVTEANLGSDIYYQGEVIGTLDTLDSETGQAAILLTSGESVDVEGESLIIADDGTIVAAMTEDELSPAADVETETGMDAEGSVSGS